ncbi:MFS transporter [Actinomadura rubrisoli]|uniref:MFS transporter n=1 Tax=Actinomadura rubrisoli TaxID=2530368 RepID=A0A4R5C6H8_9ACTN|nr:MFS transporter [Actinomadura rubrisoli]
MTLPLTVTGPAVALSDMAADLGSSVAAAQWVQNAYGVTFAACLLAAGGLADRFGRRRVLLSGLMVFCLMSVVCTVASSMLLIDIARAVQGIGAAGVLTSGAAILAASFQGPARAQAFGVLGGSFGCGLALGPLTAGALVSAGSWRAVFFVNVVIGLVVLALARFIPESRNPAATKVDWGGAATFSGSLGLLALTFVEGPESGWVTLPTLGALAGSVALMAAFAVVELRVAHPMFDLSLFRRPTFIVVVCQPFTITFGFVVLLVYLPPYFQGAGGHSATEAGALLLPLTVPVFLVPLVAGRIAAKVPLRVMLAASSTLIAAGSLWLMTLRPDSSWAELAGPLLVFGIGVGSAFGVMDNAAVSVAPVERAGMASGIFNTMRITGESVAIAGAAALLASLTLRDLNDRAPALSGNARALAGEATQGRIEGALDAVPADRREFALDAAAHGLTSAMHTVFLVLAVLALLGAITTYAVIRDRELDDSASTDPQQGKEPQ